jgi:hypothetical protein
VLIGEVSLVSAGLEVGASQAEAPGPIASSIGMATEWVDQKPAPPQNADG